MVGYYVTNSRNFSRIQDISELIPRLLTSFYPRYQLKLFSRLKQLKFCLPRFETQLEMEISAVPVGSLASSSSLSKYVIKVTNGEPGLPDQPVSAVIDCVLQ